MTRFERELSGELGAYWKSSAEKELARVREDLDAGRITIDGTEYLLHEGESIVMPAGHPHAVYGQEQFKMLLVVVF